LFVVGPSRRSGGLWGNATTQQTNTTTKVICILYLNEQLARLYTIGECGALWVPSPVFKAQPDVTCFLLRDKITIHTTADVGLFSEF
jgi:hypothetical protein